MARGTSSLDTTVTSSSAGSLTLSRGNKFNGWILLHGHSGPFQYGGGITAVVQDQTVVASQGQGDGYIDYSYRINFGYGNMDQLEERPLYLPWELQFTLENTFFGVGALEDQNLGLKASVYF